MINKPFQQDQTIQQHTIAILTDNESGVLNRVVGLFSARGYNILSLSVSEVDKEEHISRITLVTSGTSMIIEQIKAQLSRLIPVHRVVDLTLSCPFVERELAMVKIVCDTAKRTEALQVAQAFRADTVDITNETCVFQIVGKAGKIDTFIDLMKPLGLAEVSRTGTAAIGRGTNILTEKA